MKIFIKAKPMARKENIERISDTNFVVSVKEPPRDGKANEAILKALAQYFNVSRQDVKILVGHSAKQKIIQINEAHSQRK